MEWEVEQEFSKIYRILKCKKGCGNDNSTPVWQKFTFSYSDFATNSTTNNIALVTVPAKGVVMDSRLVFPETFQGGSISNYQISIGTTLNATSVHGALNGYTGVDDLNQLISPSSVVFSLTNTTDIKVFATSTDDNLDAATQGIVIVYLLIATLP